MLSTQLTILTILLLSSFIADFPLQGDYIALHKGENKYLMFVHCFIYAGVVAFTAVLLGVDFENFLPIFLILGIPHFVIDTWKAKRWYKEVYLTDLQALAIDQFMHIVLVVTILLWYKW